MPPMFKFMHDPVSGYAHVHVQKLNWCISRPGVCDSMYQSKSDQHLLVQQACKAGIEYLGDATEARGVLASSLHSFVLRYKRQELPQDLQSCPVVAPSGVPLRVTL
ncbi:unnamed protein product, partial [Sphenostylis stenocarpa]